MGRFDDLSDLDFEELVADLLGADLGLHFASYPRGPDGGVDLRARGSRRKPHVVQCKHYANSTFPQLKAAARSERSKLGEQPDFASYRFVTSRRLTDLQQQQLQRTLAPLIPSTDQILGDQDLRAMLRQHEAVERRHIKLWLPSAAALRRALRTGSYHRSSTLLQETRQALPRYVQTEAVLAAREILIEHGVCVIAGPPGVGKTTMARLLLLDALESGFQPYEVESITEAWDLFDTTEKQLFFFDDFLGRTALFERLEHDDESVLRFLRRVAREPEIRFVLTTREYVLQQARQISEAMEREAGSEHRFLLTLDRYSRTERARILYNHLTVSDDIGPESVTDLLVDRRYLDVVDHPNFNPRLIEWMTGIVGPSLSSSQRRDFGAHCLGVLDHPHQIWQQAFERGVGEAERALLFALVAVGGRCSENKLETAFEGACTSRQIATTGRAFQRSLAVLDDTFTTSTQHDGSIYIGLANPSLVDFLRGYLERSSADMEAAIRGARFFEQLEWFWGTLSGDDEGVPPPRFAAVFAEVIPSCVGASARAALRPFRSESAYRESHLLFVANACRQLPTLREPLVPWLDAELERLANRSGSSTAIEDRHIDALAALSELLGREMIGTAREWAAELEMAGEQLWAFDRLASLRRAFPALFSVEQWADEQSRFGSYAEDVLEEAAAYFDDLEDLALLDRVADDFGVTLNEDAYESAHEEISEAIAENRPDPDYDPDWEPDRDVRSAVTDETAYIDAVFGSLAEG